MAKKPPKFEALVVNAIRRLQAAQGSTETEIANYLSQEYNVTGPEVRKQIQLTLRRGMNYGILHKSKRGYVTCDRNIPNVLEVAECSHRRGSRRRGRGCGGGKRKLARRRLSGSKQRKRAACSTCSRKRAISGIRTRSGGKVKRMTRRRPAPRVAREKSKMKRTSNNNSNEDTQTRNRQQTNNNRSETKTSSKGKDEDGNQSS